MGRIRTIRPELPQSESLGRVSREARLCFILLFTVADDAGRLPGNPRMLAGLLYPYDLDAERLIGGWLKELENQDSIVRYHVEHKSYIQIRNWLKYQKVQHPTKSSLPEFTESSRVLMKPHEAYGKPHEKPNGHSADLPAWLPRDAWAGFVEMRSRIRAPLTPRGKSLLIAELEKLRSGGENPAAVLNQSIMNSWKGVFPVHGSGRSNGHARLPDLDVGKWDGTVPATAECFRCRSEFQRDRAVDRIFCSRQCAEAKPGEKAS